MKKNFIIHKRNNQFWGVGIILLSILLHSGCGTQPIAASQEETISVPDTELFSFIDETADSQNGGDLQIDYNETPREIDAIKLKWGEKLPYFKLSEEMGRKFWNYMFAYTTEEFPYEKTGNIGASVNYAGFYDDEERYDIVSRFNPIETGKPIRIYIMLVIEEGSANVRLRENEGEVKWESGVVTESQQFFLEFDELHMEQPIIEIDTKKTSEENVRYGLWHAFYGHV